MEGAESEQVAEQKDDDVDDEEEEEDEDEVEGMINLLVGQEYILALKRDDQLQFGQHATKKEKNALLERIKAERKREKQKAIKEQQASKDKAGEAANEEL